MTSIHVCKITSRKPSRLSKHYYLDADANLQKQPGGALVQGRVEPLDVDGLDGFVELLQALTPAQALTYGGPPVAADVTTKQEHGRLGQPDSPIPRARSHFPYQPQPGVLLLDYDPANDGDALDRDALVAAIRYAAPALADVRMVWWPSSSSHVVNGDTGTDLTGLRGQRLYIAVADARDIPRAGQVLVDRLWVAGYGHFEVSKSGALLERTLIDATVWQGERLDFAAGASTAPPLRQERGQPVILDGNTDVLDTATDLPDLSAEDRARVDAAKATARAASKSDADAQRNQWVEERVAELTGTEATDDARRAARETVIRAVDHQVLAGDFKVQVSTNGGSREVAVGTILDDPARWHGQLTYDPLEPDYDGGRPVGKLYVMGARPKLYSFAHGGCTFKLMRAPAKVELVKGRFHDTIDDVLRILRRQSDVFDYDDQLVQVSNGHIRPFTRYTLMYYLSGATQFWKWRHIPNVGYQEELEDPPLKICDALHELRSERGLKHLTAIATAPTLRPDGTVLHTPGYDPATGILLELPDDAPEIPDQPTEIQVKRAINKLMWPFMSFPFEGAVDRAVWLAALLTAVVRPAMPTSPAFGVDAPAQGSGKTLLAKCVAALATGTEPEIWPHTSGDTDEEVRKRLITALIEGKRVIVWDNILGSIGSGSMAAALTTPHYTDRVLGRSASIQAPNKAVFVLTGNNLELAGDLPRRVLKMRITPECEQPFARQFTLDPLAFVQEHRQELAAAALTIIRGYMAHATDTAAGALGSFEDWDRLVRQPVAWLGRRGLAPDFGDPLDAINVTTTQDPQRETLATLVRTLGDLFPNQEFTAQDVKKSIERAKTGFGGENDQILADALRDISGKNEPTSRTIGMILKHRRDRIVDGQRLEERTAIKKTARWAVASVAAKAA